MHVSPPSPRDLVETLPTAFREKNGPIRTNFFPAFARSCLIPTQKRLVRDIVIHDMTLVRAIDEEMTPRKRRGNDTDPEVENAERGQEV